MQNFPRRICALTAPILLKYRSAHLLKQLDHSTDYSHIKNRRGVTLWLSSSASLSLCPATGPYLILQANLFSPSFRRHAHLRPSGWICQLRTMTHPNYRQIPNSYRAVNTHCLGYKNQSVDVQRNKCCLF